LAVFCPCNVHAPERGTAQEALISLFLRFHPRHGARSFARPAA
jgi:hypothetical protein